MIKKLLFGVIISIILYICYPFSKVQAAQLQVDHRPPNTLNREITEIIIHTPSHSNSLPPVSSLNQFVLYDLSQAKLNASRLVLRGMIINP